jgi:hypothetical protein
VLRFYRFVAILFGHPDMISTLNALPGRTLLVKSHQLLRSQPKS